MHHFLAHITPNQDVVLKKNNSIFLIYLLPYITVCKMKKIVTADMEKIKNL